MIRRTVVVPPESLVNRAGPPVSDPSQSVHGADRPCGNERRHWSHAAAPMVEPRPSGTRICLLRSMCREFVGPPRRQRRLASACARRQTSDTPDHIRHASVDSGRSASSTPSRTCSRLVPIDPEALRAASAGRSPFATRRIVAMQPMPAVRRHHRDPRPRRRTRGDRRSVPSVHRARTRARTKGCDRRCPAPGAAEKRELAFVQRNATPNDPRDDQSLAMDRGDLSVGQRDAERGHRGRRARRRLSSRRRRSMSSMPPTRRAPL